MVTIMLAKFVLNDVPHAAGIVDSAQSLPIISVPKPQYFTHYTSEWRRILESGHIDPAGDIFEPTHKPSTSLSIDGSWVGGESSRGFKFGIKEIIDHYRTRPVFYLGTTLLHVEYLDRFTVYDTSSIWAMEVEVLDTIPITEKHLIGPLPKTPLRKYISNIAIDLELLVTPILIGTSRTYKTTPTSAIGARITAYNRMIASLFGIDYIEVLHETEMAIAEGRAQGWSKWW